jgi:DNA-directed RNA polymerase omega subunit
MRDKSMKPANIEQVDRVTVNRYEAVIVASKHARHINSVRLAKLKRSGETEAPEDFESRKITAVALRDLIDGKVKFDRSDSK